MGAAEELAFINGNGTGKPTGVLNTAEVGVTSAASNAITTDEIIDLYHSLRTPYRKNAIFMSSDSTIKAIRKLKDSNGQYLWQPGLQAGQPDTILNRPIHTSAYMPEIESGNKILLFGDLSYYWVADRQGRSFQRLNELFAKNGQVGFRVFQRLDGKLILPESVKITTSCSGLTFSFSEGQTVDVGKKIGEDLVQCGFAEEVRDTKTTRRDTKSKTVQSKTEE